MFFKKKYGLNILYSFKLRELIFQNLKMKFFNKVSLFKRSLLGKSSYAIFKPKQVFYKAFKFDILVKVFLFLIKFFNKSITKRFAKCFDF